MIAHPEKKIITATMIAIGQNHSPEKRGHMGELRMVTFCAYGPK
jgi:hypothetical protein